MEQTSAASSPVEQSLLAGFDSWMAANREAFVQDLIQLVNIKSVSAPGEGGYAFGTGCAHCLDAALEIADRMGLDTQNHDYYSGSALLRGTGADELGLVAHLDVVPEGGGWDWPPYNATLLDGYVIGRGASDDKGAAVAALYTLKYLKDTGFAPNYTLRVLMGCNEEKGMQDMVHYKTHYTPPIFSMCCDSGFPFHNGEKGRYSATLQAPANTGEIAELYGGTAANSIADTATIVLVGAAAQKALAAGLESKDGIKVENRPDGGVAITAQGKAGHAAFPEGSQSAIQKLAATVAGAGLVSGENLAALRFLADAFADYYGAGLNIAFEDAPSGKLTHAGGLLTLEDGVITQSLDVRYPVGLANASEIRSRVQAVCGAAGFAVTDETDDPPFYIPPQHPALQVLARTSAELMDLDGDGPFVMRGGTHCRKLPNMVGYGPFLQSRPAREAKDKFGHAHGPNEAVRLQQLYDAVRVYAVTLARLNQLPPEALALGQ